jgi:hypothetical protein
MAFGIADRPNNSKNIINGETLKGSLLGLVGPIGVQLEARRGAIDRMDMLSARVRTKRNDRESASCGWEPVILSLSFVCSIPRCRCIPALMAVPRVPAHAVRVL